MTRVALFVLGVLLAGACGGRSSDSVVVAALGDSITAGSPGYDPHPEVLERAGRAANERSQWEYWAQRRDRQLVFHNCGVAGERTDEIALRLKDCARGADVLVVQGGVNDVAQLRSVDVAARNLQAMVREGKRLGLRVALADVLPWNNGYAGARPQIILLNARIRAVARAERVPLLPFYATLEDPSRPGQMQAAWTSDGNHPSVAGYRRLGELAFRVPPR
jgi:lysophospholipase L1-like esterase